MYKKSNRNKLPRSGHFGDDLRELFRDPIEALATWEEDEPEPTVTDYNNRDWRLVLRGDPWGWQEWLIPARILNEHASVRQLKKDEWEQALAKYKDAQRLKTIEALDDLRAAGLLIAERDSQGRPMYRNGKLVYKLSEKGQRLAKHDNNKISRARRS
jgi:hypothetical protein